MHMDMKNYKNRHSLKSKLARVVWEIVWLTLFRPTPRYCLHAWRRFLLRLFGAKLAQGVRVLPSCKVWQPWNLEMEEYSCMAEDVECYSVDKITIGANAVVSQGAFLCGASHDISSPTMELTYAPISIGRGAWVASRAFVGMGVTIGEGAVVGACAVVTKDVEPWSVVAGNPAKFIKKRVIQMTD